MVSERLGISLQLDEPEDARATARAYANLAMRAVSAIETSALEAKKSAAAALTASGHAAEARRVSSEGLTAIAEMRASLTNIENHFGLVHGLPIVPVAPARPASQHDIEEVQGDVDELREDLETFKKEATNPGIGHTPSDPAEAAKKVGVGFAILAWRGARRGAEIGFKFSIEHWKELSIALMATGHLPWLWSLIQKLPPVLQHLLKP